MLNLRYIFRLISAFFLRFRALILIGIGFGVLFFFVIRFLIPLIVGRNVERTGLTGRFTITNLPNDILEMVGRGLTKIDKNGNITPDLAESWETPDKGKTWIFKLKNDIFWQDGKKIVSNGISYQFTDVTIERPDNRTIVFKLQNSYSAFPLIVAKPTFEKGLLGSGEWRVKKLSLNGNYIESMTLKNKNNKQIIYKFFPTEERTKLAFKLGEVDLIKDLIDPTPFNTWDKVKITKTTNTGESVAIFFNTTDKNLAEKSLRQALNYAINKSAFGNDRAISPISIDSWAFNPQVKPYKYDHEKAKKIIDDYKKTAKIDSLELTLTTSPILLSQAEKIAKDWEAVGVKVKLQVFSNIPGDYQTLLAIFDIPEDPDQYSMWHSTQTATNITHHQDPRIDKLLEDGRSQINLEDRKKIYLDFQRFLVEDSPAAFLYYPTIFTIKR